MISKCLAGVYGRMEAACSTAAYAASVVASTVRCHASSARVAIASRLQDLNDKVYTISQGFFSRHEMREMITNGLLQGGFQAIAYMGIEHTYENYGPRAAMCTAAASAFAIGIIAYRHLPQWCVSSMMSGLTAAAPLSIVSLKVALVVPSIITLHSEFRTPSKKDPLIFDWGCMRAVALYAGEIVGGKALSAAALCTAAIAQEFLVPISERDRRVSTHFVLVPRNRPGARKWPVSRIRDELDGTAFPAAQIHYASLNEMTYLVRHEANKAGNDITVLQKYTCLPSQAPRMQHIFRGALANRLSDFAEIRKFLQLSAQVPPEVFQMILDYDPRDLRQEVLYV